MKKIFLGLMACAALCACTSDDVAVDNTIQEFTDGVYMRFNISTATTRSATNTEEGADYGTSDTGIEYGQDYENAVKDIAVVLVDADGKTIATADVEDAAKVGDDTYVVCFQKDDIKDYASTDVDVYVYCNQGEKDSFKENETYALTAADDDTPWTSGGFYMSSAVAHSTTLPTDITSYNSVANPIDLGVVRVERSMARFDYKDGAISNDPTVNHGNTTAFTYPIWYDDDDALVAQLELKEAAVINMSEEFYTLRHMAESEVSSNPAVANLNAVTILDTEYTDNWVIDTDAEAKLEDSATGFYYSMEDPTTWQFDDITNLSTADKDETWNDPDNYGDYYIWRYVTENTIPSVEAQTHGITTGIVFKTELVDRTANQNLFTEGARVYVYEEQAYANWEAVAAAAAAAEADGSTLANAYAEVMEVWDVKAEDTTEYDADVTAAMAQAGFTGYSPDSEGKYYMYYYYWNRHNDNNDPNNMGIMEFAVVRNNVYKLSVTEILKYGHPNPGTEPGTNPDPDPDPVDPDDPDESTDIYLKVDVEILPWVVRVNDITF